MTEHAQTKICKTKHIKGALMIQIFSWHSLSFPSKPINTYYIWQDIQLGPDYDYMWLTLQ